MDVKFKEFDTVRILRKCNEEVQIGDIGVIVMVFDNPNEAYEVEVIDGEGVTKAQCTLLPNELELVEH